MSQRSSRSHLDARKSENARLLVLHPVPEWVDIRAIDFGLAKHREGDYCAISSSTFCDKCSQHTAIVDHAEFLNLVVAARILTTELVAGKA